MFILTQKRLIHHLKEHFHYSSFRPGQQEIITDVLKGKDVLGILPTGSGKSLCYQLPAQIITGVTIVISPLISLMLDQVRELKANHFKEVVAINSFMSYTERENVYKNLHNYKLIYVSPELIQQKRLLNQLKQINVQLFVIDEAHCISQWGHEFRPDYLKLKTVVKQLNNPTILALSATAANDIQQDIIKLLDRPEMVKYIYPIDRDNIVHCVEEVQTEENKIARITQLLIDYKVPTLIYFSSRRASEEVATTIKTKLPDLKIAFYHGGLEPSDRIAIQQQFMNDQLHVICCTSAFGMGINKENIRLIIHYHFPSQLESYIQEVGRAGRDGKQSVGLVLYSKNDAYLPRFLIENEIPTEEQLIFSLKLLAHMAKNDQKIPENELDLLEMFQLTETQWRFLHYQFEKNGIIKNNHIYYKKKNWKHSFYKINEHRSNRLIFKNTKLTEIIHWLNEKDCLRKHLYKKFQDKVKMLDENCCNQCGFSFSEWDPEQLTTITMRKSSWEDKLKSIFLIEAK